jgi:GrpB-like predicted nucleotidyltransferase (UPF0157 family)
MVEIVPYKESWPLEFQEIAARLRHQLGELALRIDHIGSTSVPGLPAKDVIDIQITIVAFDDRVRSAMTSLGYTQPEGIWRDHCPPHVVASETDWERCSSSHRLVSVVLIRTCERKGEPINVTRFCSETICVHLRCRGLRGTQASPGAISG